MPGVRQEAQTKRKSDPKRPNSSGGAEALPFRFRSQTLLARHVLTHQEYTDPWIFSSRPFSPHSGHDQLHIPNILWNFWQLETEYLMKAGRWPDSLRFETSSCCG